MACVDLQRLIASKTGPTVWIGVAQGLDKFEIGEYDFSNASNPAIVEIARISFALIEVGFVYSSAYCPAFSFIGFQFPLHELC